MGFVIIYSEDFGNFEGTYMECVKCGQKLDKAQKVCPKCGTPVGGAVESINDLFAAKEKETKKTKKRAKRSGFDRVLQISGAVAVAAFVLVFFLVGDAGRLHRAKLCAQFKYYAAASRIADTCKDENNQVYKDYYMYLSYADRLLKEDNLSKYEEIISNMADYDGKLNYSLLSVKEREKYSKIEKAIRVRDGYDIDAFEEQIMIPVLLEEQIQQFKDGKPFDHAEIKDKAESWRAGFEQANKLYGEVMSTELPSYVNVIQELDKVLENLADPKYENESNVYFTKYNSSYQSPYTSRDASTMLENVQRQADYNCSKSVCWALYQTERGVKLPQMSEYKKNTGDDVEAEADITLKPTKKPEKAEITEYYGGFDNIPDFGYYSGIEPASAKDFDYYYSYAGNEDVNIYDALSKYEQAMYNASFEMADLTDSKGTTTYEYTNGRYGVAVVHYSETKHVDIHIKNMR